MKSIMVIVFGVFAIALLVVHGINIKNTEAAALSVPKIIFLDKGEKLIGIQAITRWDYSFATRRFRKDELPETTRISTKKTVRDNQDIIIIETP